MKKFLLFLMVVFLTVGSISADTYVDRSLTIMAGQSVIEALDGGSGCTINNSYKDVVSCEYVGYSNYKRNFKFTGIKRGFATVVIQVPGYHYTYSITVKDIVSVALPSSISLSLGEEYTFTPIIADSGATTTFSWQSTNPSVATIDSDGKLTTQGLGTTTIMCTASNGISGQCLVTVNPLIATNLQIDNSSVEMLIGETLQLNAQILPENAQQHVIWSSSDKTIAKVINGLVYALDWGECLITATTIDGSNLSTNCFVTILPQESNKCDVNGDGAVTATDITEIYNYILSH